MALEKGPNWSEAIESLVNTLGAKLLTLMLGTSVNLLNGKKKKNSSQTNLSEMMTNCAKLHYSFTSTA